MFKKYEIEKLGWPVIEKQWDRLPKWLVEENKTYDQHPTELAPIIGLSRFSKAKTIVEVGVSSGRTSALIIQALKNDGINPTVYGIDLAEFIYFNPIISTGQIIYETFPEHADNFKLYTLHTAFDAEEIFGDKKIELVFIDANHVHPWPTIEFLLLLPHLSKNALVVLSNVSWEDETSRGPKYLYRNWNGEKYQFHCHYPSQTIKDKFTKIKVNLRKDNDNVYPEGALSNTAVIKPYEDIEKTLENIFEILALEWEAWQCPEASLHKAHAKKLTGFLQKHYGRAWANQFERLTGKAGKKVFKHQPHDGSWIFTAKDKKVDSYLDYMPKNINIHWEAFEEKFPVIQNITRNKTNTITLCFASDENYMKFLGVTLKSILINHHGNAFFDIIILTNKVTEETKELLLKEFSGHKENLLIRYIDVTALLFIFGNALVQASMTDMSAYSRIFAIKILSNYEKYLYLDIDLIVNTDIQPLFKTDTKNFPVAGVLCPGRLKLGTRFEYSPTNIQTLKDYMVDFLEVDPSNYINSGVTLWNPGKISQHQRYALYKQINCNFKYGDQDIINIVFHQKKFLLNSVWNFQPLNYCSYPQEVIENFKIMHWVWVYKPWLREDAKLGEYWWKYARQMSYYETLLHDFVMADLPKRMNRSSVSPTELGQHLSFDNLLALHPTEMDYHKKLISLKMAFRISKAGFVKNNPKKAVMLRPVYKLFKRPAKYILKTIVVPKVLA